MKILFLFLLSCQVIYGQNFFPFEPGNKFQHYNTTYVQIAPNVPPVFHYWQALVTGNTLIIDGKECTWFQGPEYLLMQGWYHFDELEQMLYVSHTGDSLRPAVDFSVANQDTFLSYILGNPYYFTSFGKSLQSTPFDSVMTYMMRLEKISGQISHEYIFVFAENLGLLEKVDSKKDYSYPPYYIKWHWSYSLRSAICGDSIYAPITLKLDSVSPLGNIHLEQFPVTFHAEYTTNLNGFYGMNADTLISYFNIKVIQIRGNDTIATINKNFNNNNNAAVNLIPEAGDKLLIRVVIKDRTIFLNEDTFPDSGYAEILVLPSTVDVNDDDKPYLFHLEQNYPNPFNPSTTIRYNIPERSFVVLTIYDAMGNEIVKSVNEEKEAGLYTYKFDGTALSNGVYFYKITAGNYSEVKKMLLLK